MLNGVKHLPGFDAPEPDNEINKREETLHSVQGDRFSAAIPCLADDIESPRRSDPPMKHRTLREAIRATVCRIPPGRAATYGDVARLAGSPRSAREVGRTLSALPEGSDVPWWRVVNREGSISPRLGAERQTARLAAEGVQLDVRGRIDLIRLRWDGEE